MALSQVAICNRALDYCRVDPITSLDDASEPARLCKRNYEFSRDAALRAYPWNSAMRRAALAALVEVPAWGFARQFNLPADCLRVWHVDGTPEPTWRVEGRRILSDADAPLRILYLARVDDPAQFDPLLADAIAARLAVDIGPKLIESNAAVEGLRQRYRDVLAEARQADAQEGTPEEFEMSGWLEARA